jgi:acetyl-CoA carboxylase biotin carboxylase subunit
VLPGTDDGITDLAAAHVAGQELGFPLIIKATAGGGGRGMRMVRAAEELDAALAPAQREAEAAFGDKGIYLEKSLESARHIEFQVLADHHGHVVHLGERECSLQRRHQKVLEESPSVAITGPTRERLGRMVVEAARAVGYRNAGTFEFLMDRDGCFYFLEANARLQVEHPVTEMVTGLDLVKEQIRIAAGEPMWFAQGDVSWSGHALECRVNAECPETYVPSAGVIKVFSVPGGPGVRVDTYAHADCTIPPYYDSLVAKIIAHGRDRAEAIARMRRTLEMTVIEGIKTTIPLHLKILDDPDFQAGRLTTRFLERFIPGASGGREAAPLATGPSAER